MSEQQNYTLTLTKEELALIQQLVSTEYRTVVSYGQGTCVPETMRDFRDGLTDKFGSILHKINNS
jgi:hypothetical protein